MQRWQVALAGARGPVVFGVLALAVCSQATARAQVVHTFTYQYDGQYPEGGVIQDASGALYGTTFAGSGGYYGSGGGIVYRLLPPSRGSIGWTQQTLYAFPYTRRDGDNPVGDLLMDAHGGLVGITSGSSNDQVYGTVFRLQPHFAASGYWGESNLHIFRGADGAQPVGGLVADASGTLYGVTALGGPFNQGTVFSLSPPVAPATAWTLQTLHAFSGTGGDGGFPVGRLVLDATGDVFGTTRGNASGGRAPGIAFELSPDTGAAGWTETILHVFSDPSEGTVPLAGLTLSGEGVLYGTTSSGGGTACVATCGVAFALTPPGTSGAAWQYGVIHVFADSDGESPQASMVLDASGNLRGTTFYGGHVTSICSYGCGVVFSLAPPHDGSTAWTETSQAPQDSNHGANFDADLLLTADGLMYGTARDGGMPDGSGFGTVFRLPQ